MKQVRKIYDKAFKEKAIQLSPHDFLELKHLNLNKKNIY